MCYSAQLFCPLTELTAFVDHFLCLIDVFLSSDINYFCLFVVFPPMRCFYPTLVQRSKQGKSTQVCRFATFYRSRPSINQNILTICYLVTPLEKDLGFLRIGSLNVRVKKTTEAFSNFLGVGHGTQRQGSHPQQRYRNTIQQGHGSRHRPSATLTEENEPDGPEVSSKTQPLKPWNSVDDIPVVR